MRNGKSDKSASLSKLVEIPTTKVSPITVVDKLEDITCYVEESSNASVKSSATARKWFKSRSLKACVRYFLTYFYFSWNDSPSKTMKGVFYFI